MTAVTRLGLHGGPRQSYGPFAGKVAQITRLTRLGLHGGPRPLYGVFTSKTAAIPAARLRHEGLRRNVGRMMR